MNEILNRLADYTIALKNALDSTNQSNERPLLINHLAASAEMFALLNQSNDVTAIQDLIKLEVQAHGRSFISGHDGDVVEKNWALFIKETGWV